MCILSNGSVIVTFDLWFNRLVDVKEVEQELGAGLQEVGDRGLVIDRNSIQITGECLMRGPCEVIGLWDQLSSFSVNHIIRVWNSAEKPDGTTTTPTMTTTTTVPPTSGECRSSMWLMFEVQLTIWSPSSISTVTCPPHQESCADQLTCVPIDRFCDGVDDCPDAFDEDATHCGQQIDTDLSLLKLSNTLFCQQWLIGCG